MTHAPEPDPSAPWWPDGFDDEPEALWPEPVSYADAGAGGVIAFGRRYRG